MKNLAVDANTKKIAKVTFNNKQPKINQINSATTNVTFGFFMGLYLA